MKVNKTSFFAILTSFATLIACNSNSSSNVQSFGEPVDTTKAISALDLPNAMGDLADLTTTISGKVVNVCKAEGCWLKVDLGEDEPLMVRMKDHSFNVTENVVGKFVFISGYAYYDSLSVDKLRDDAKDAGAGPEEIASISKPELELVFQAKGIAVR